jgi:hypothetical protein
MKRNLEICRKCPCFRKRKLIPWNSLRTDIHYMCWDGVTKEDYYGRYECITLDEWEKRDLSKRCIMRTEYCLKEWNNEEKTEEKS